MLTPDDKMKLWREASVLKIRARSLRAQGEEQSVWGPLAIQSAEIHEQIAAGCDSDLERGQHLWEAQGLRKNATP